MDKSTDTIYTYGDAIRDICYHPAGNKLACASDRYLMVWDTKQLMQTVKFNCSTHLGSYPKKIRYSTSGDKMAVIGKDVGCVIDMTTMKVIASVNTPNNSANVLFTPDDRHVILTNNNRVCMWNYQTQELLNLKNHADVIMALAISHDGKYIASGDSRGDISVWSLGDNREISSLKGRSTILAMKFLRTKSELLVSDNYPTNVMYNYINGDRDGYAFRVSENNIMGVDVDKDDEVIICGGGDGRVYVTELPTYKRIDTLQSHNKSINCVQFAPDGNTFASGANDSTIRIYKTQKGIHVH